MSQFQTQNECIYADAIFRLILKCINRYVVQELGLYDYGAIVMTTCVITVNIKASLFDC